MMGTKLIQGSPEKKKTIGKGGGGKGGWFFFLGYPVDYSLLREFRKFLQITV